MPPTDYPLLGARAAATDIRAWARSAIENNRADIRDIIIEALLEALDGLNAQAEQEGERHAD